MARTHPKWLRPFIDGYELCGYARSVGMLGAMYDAPLDAALCDNIKNTILGQPEMSCGPVNAFLAPSATVGFHELMQSVSQTGRSVLIAIGVNAEPVAGNPVFAWSMAQKSYQQTGGDGFVTVNVDFGGSSQAAPRGFDNPWGVLHHANSAETAVNTAIGLDNGAATTGGTFHYQLISSNGSVTLKLQDAAVNTNVSFADISGATSGVLAAAPAAGMVSIPGAIRQFTRWQLVFGTATTATFLVSLNRE